MAFRSSLAILSRTIKRTAKGAVAVFLFQEYIGGFVLCTGPSMEPTIYDKNILITDHLSPRIGNLSKGDVIVARNPINFQCICKRIVGVPGDKVYFKGELIKVPKNHFWLEGDNKGNSSDSRDYGPVHVALIRRRCFCKIWPSIDINFQNAIQFTAAAAAVPKSVLSFESFK